MLSIEQDAAIKELQDDVKRIGKDVHKVHDWLLRLGEEVVRLHSPGDDPKP